MISILMPIYNGYQFFSESYASLISQTYQNWELLIGINGHEQDSSVYQNLLKIVNNDNRVKIYQYPLIKNKAKTLNSLLLEAKNNIICLLDVDDKWHQDKLLSQLSYINEYDIVGTGCRYFGDRSDKPNIPYGLIDKNIFSLLNPVINSSSMFLKRDAYWNETLPGLEDYDIWLRLNKEGKKFFNLYQELCYHRIHKTSHFNTQDFSKLEFEIKDKWKL